MEENSLDKFKFVRRRLSVHYSISREIAAEKESEESTPNKSPVRNIKSINRKRSIIMQEQSIKKLKDIYLKNNTGFFFHNEERLSDYSEQVLNYNLVKKYLMGDYDKDFQNYVDFGEPVKLRYTLDQFVGVRFALFCYSTKKAGGSAIFKDFEIGIL